jgi:DNA modification methylase
MKDYRNKILCGDCIELLGKAKEPFADLVFSDPPYRKLSYMIDLR